MAEEKDGGPAFPCPTGNGSYFGPVRGMTLRDYFAAAALTGLWANPDVSRAAFQGDAKPSDVGNILAQGAYDQADAMLKAREASNG